eukprot:1074438-Amphidinium_carterae.1
MKCKTQSIALLAVASQCSSCLARDGALARGYEPLHFQSIPELGAYHTTSRPAIGWRPELRTLCDE